ncbi:unnamed protein product [Prunus brigantina]
MRTLKAEEGERFHTSAGASGRVIFSRLTAAHPGNGSPGGRVQRPEEHRTSRGVRCAPGDP